MLKIILSFFFLSTSLSINLIFPLSSFATEETLSITTYYPAPYGVYGHLRIYPTDACPAAPNDCNANKGGLMFYSGSYSGTCGSSRIVTETMYFCNGTDWITMQAVSDDEIWIGTLDKDSTFDITAGSGYWQTVTNWTVSGPCAATNPPTEDRLAIDLNGDGATGTINLPCTPSCPDCRFGRGIYMIEWGGGG